MLMMECVVTEQEQQAKESRVTSGTAESMLIHRVKLGRKTNMVNNILKIRKLYYVFLFLSGFAFSQLAFANGETPVSDGLRYVTNAMYGATGVAIATISVMIVGLLCLGHFLKWSTLGYTIVGISFIFGAGSIVNGIISLVH